MGDRIVVASLVLALALFATGPEAHADDEATTEGIAAAEAWLKLVDQGEFGKSWETAAALFKGAVTEEQWQQQMTASRRPLGKRIFRKVTLAKYETALPGAPDGEYVVIQFKSAFENKVNAVETVTPMKDPDGEWRVAGYSLK